MKSLNLPALKIQDHFSKKNNTKKSVQNSAEETPEGIPEYGTNSGDMGVVYVENNTENGPNIKQIFFNII